MQSQPRSENVSELMEIRDQLRTRTHPDITWQVLMQLLTYLIREEMKRHG